MLADPNAPLVLADGTKIDPQTGRKVKENRIEIPSATEAQKLVTKTRRTLADLPAPDKQMSAFAVVGMYSLYGLLDHEIAVATGLAVEQVERIKQQRLYQDFVNDVCKTVRAAEADVVRDLITNHANDAVKRVVEVMHDEDAGPAVQLNAAKDILDRAGHRPADVVITKTQEEKTLRIEYVEVDESANAPTIDVDYKEL